MCQLCPTCSAFHHQMEVCCRSFTNHQYYTIINYVCSSEADRIEAPIELVAHVRKIAASMVNFYTISVGYMCQY